MRAMLIVAFALASCGPKLPPECSALLELMDRGRIVTGAISKADIDLARERIELLAEQDPGKAGAACAEIMSKSPLLATGSEPPAARSEPDPPAPVDWPASCDKFMRTYQRCIDSMPEAARAPAADGLRQMQEAWRQAPRDLIDDSCKQAWEAAKGSMGAACPGVVW